MLPTSTNVFHELMKLEIMSIESYSLKLETDGGEILKKTGFLFSLLAQFTQFLLHSLRFLAILLSDALSNSRRAKRQRKIEN